MRRILALFVATLFTGIAGNFTPHGEAVPRNGTATKQGLAEPTNEIPECFEEHGNLIVQYSNGLKKSIELYRANAIFKCGPMKGLEIYRDQSFKIVPGECPFSDSIDNTSKMDFRATRKYLHIEYGNRAVTIPWQLLDNAKKNAIQYKNDGL